MMIGILNIPKAKATNFYNNLLSPMGISILRLLAKTKIENKEALLFSKYEKISQKHPYAKELIMNIFLVSSRIIKRYLNNSFSFSPLH